jgi:hypothetical protein
MQMDSLKSEISSATQKSHQLEFQVARANGLLEAKGVETATVQAKKPKAANTN